MLYISALLFFVSIFNELSSSVYTPFILAISFPKKSNISVGNFFVKTKYFADDFVDYKYYTYFLENYCCFSETRLIVIISEFFS
jgi:hypothetical protein